MEIGGHEIRTLGRAVHRLSALQLVTIPVGSMVPSIITQNNDTLVQQPRLAIISEAYHNNNM